MDDEEFVRDVYHASYRRLVGQLVGITGSSADAEDVVQEAFVRAINNARAFRRTDNPEAWLRRVAVNVARSRWRRLKHLTGLAPKLVEPQKYDDLSTDRLALLDALKQLPAPTPSEPTQTPQVDIGLSAEKLIATGDLADVAFNAAGDVLTLWRVCDRILPQRQGVPCRRRAGHDPHSRCR